MESDAIGTIEVPAEHYWGAQTQRSLIHFSIGEDLMPREVLRAYAWVKKAAAIANARAGKLAPWKAELIGRVADEIGAGLLDGEFPLHLWQSGSGTQTNMNVNEVIANRCCRISGTPLGSKTPVHPNDDANLSQSTNDTFPSAMYIAAAIAAKGLLPEVGALQEAIAAKAEKWKGIVKIGRTHLQDATPLTLGQEWSAYVCMLQEAAAHIGHTLEDVYRLPLGGTIVGTGFGTVWGFAENAVGEIARMTGLPFVCASNKFSVQGAHDALVRLSGALRGLAASLFKIANDIRLLGCGPRCGLHELVLPANEPGSSIMPGKVNPTQCEAIAMVAVQVMSNDVAVAFGAASGYLEMNVYKPLIIANLLHSIRILGDGSRNFRQFLVEGTEPDIRQIDRFVGGSLMLVTALSPVIGYDKAAEIAHYAHDHELTLKEAALALGYVSKSDFDRLVDPKKMLSPDPQRQ